MSMYEQGLDKNPANFVSQSPLSFIERAAQVYPYKTAVMVQCSETGQKFTLVAAVLHRRSRKSGSSGSTRSR